MLDFSFDAALQGAGGNQFATISMKVALGVSGGIAAYKAAEIVRLLQDRGIRVQVIMTRAAQEFVRPLTFAALSGEKVITDLFGTEAEQPNIDSAVEHIAVAQSIDALVVVPATADVLAKFAQGVANDFLTTLYLATTAPVVMAPAMNVNMWNHEATQSNLHTLRDRGVRIVEPGDGYLACGMTGPGRLAENEAIVAAVLEALGVSQDLVGETILITAGPTREKIDPVRYLTNRSSGRMGYALAEAALRRGAKVLLITGPTSITPPSQAEVTRVESAEQMREAVLKLLPESTIVIKTAAVADYKPEAGRAEDQAQRPAQSRSRADPRYPRRTLAQKDSQLIIGFAAETAAMVICPATPRRRSIPSSASASSSSDSTRCVRVTSAAAASVSRTPRPCRSSSCWPVSISELGELLRHRGSRDVERFGRGDNRAVGRHRVQRAQAIEVQHPRDSKLKQSRIIHLSLTLRGRIVDR